jgi:hypothetical protein
MQETLFLRINKSGMRHIIIIALLLPLFTWSQDCKLTRETDPFTKETKISTGFIQLQGGSVTIDADRLEVDIFFTLEGSDKCFDNNSTAAIFFEGTKIKMSSRNSGSMNCEGFFHFTFRNTAATASLLQKMSTQKLTSIVFIGSNKKETKVTFIPEQQQVFLSLANCLVNEAKTLVK